MEWLFALDQLPAVAADFLRHLGPSRVIALDGPMGAGKTTLVSAICKVLGVRDAVSSPTFSLVNEYLLPDGEALYHIDLYRVRDEAEAVEAGIADCVDSGSYCIVEWPERAPGLFTGDTRRARIEMVDATRRRLKLEDAGGNP